MTAAHSTTVYSAERQPWVADMHQYIVYTGAAGRSVFKQVFNRFPAIAKNIEG
ncbi:hypothetical protein D9M68_696020 [compost metagenome]